nr:hypothetical protein [Tanacetum cinerariifolium]
MMADQRTMAELLRAPTEGYADAIVVPPILAEHFELKHTAVNYNQGNSGYRPSSVANQIRTPSFSQPNVLNNQNRISQPQVYNRGNNFNQDTSYQAPIQKNQVVPLRPLPSNTIDNPKYELKAITTRSGIILDGPSDLMTPPFINPEEDERVEESLTDLELAE